MSLVATRLDDYEALAALQDEWRDLWRRARASPFQSPQWLLPWWRCFRPGRLRAVAVRDGGKLVALAPLYREGSGRDARIVPIGLGLSDWLDLLVDEARASDAAAAIARTLRAEDVRVDMEDLPPASVAARAAWPGYALRVEPHEVLPALHWEAGRDPVTMLPARKRRQLRRAQAFASARGAFRIDDMRERPVEFLGLLAKLHALRWRARGEAGVLDERVLAFHRAASPELAADGLMRCYTLFIDGRPAAAWYGLAAHGCWHAYLGGFDPAFARESPGALVMAHALAEAAREGARSFDLLRGREPYKYSWGARDVGSLRCILEPAP